jgi:hypothetical protein
MKVKDFLHKDFSIKNNSKLRKIKLSICNQLLRTRMLIMHHKLIISLASQTQKIFTQ